MPTARTYEHMTIVGEPYKNGKNLYVKVVGKCPRCGGSGNYSFNYRDGTMCLACRGSGKEYKEVRWYTEAQRASMDKAAEKRKQEKEEKREKYDFRINAHSAFGFGDDNYIMLLIGKHDDIMTWRDTLPQYSIFWNEYFHWYIPSANYSNLSIPENMKVVKLTWDMVAADDKHIIDKEEVKHIVRDMTVEDSKSEWQGEVGEWLTKTVIVKKNVTLEDRYGIKHLHVLWDENENEYVWSSTSKDYKVDETITLKMKVKEHKEYEGTKQTVVWYCKEAK